MENVFHRVRIRKYEDKAVERKNHTDIEGGNAGTECM